MTRRLMGPFSRVEGHLEIELERDETKVLDAKVNAPLYRGMETVMLGHPPMDALTIAPRICGICSVAQSIAAAKALRSLTDYQLVPNARLMEDLVLGCEMLSNHLTHFYLFFMPDFVHPVYENEDWFQDAEIFQSELGTAQKDAINVRTKLLQMMGILAGKWPHTLCIRPGGSTVSLKSTDKQKLKITLGRFKRFLEKTLFGLPLDQINQMQTQDDLNASQGHFGFFLKISDELSLQDLGRTEFSFLSSASFETPDVPLFKHQLLNGQNTPWSKTQIIEELSHSFMLGDHQDPNQKHNADFDLDKEKAYSWCKTPRLDNNPCEVGAYARHLIRKTPLIRDIHETSKSTVYSRIVSRVWEMAFLCDRMMNWIDQIDPSEPFYEDIELPEKGQGFGATEAARGTLMHWLEVENNAISNYQIIAPTTWNFAPRDRSNIKAPLEQALENAPIRADEKDPASVRHIVRSFDPCMACTVH